MGSIISLLGAGGLRGIMRLPYIMRGIKSGTIKLRVKPTIVSERSSTILLDGRYGLGHYIASKAMKLAVTKAKRTGLAAVGIFNSNHTCSPGNYAEIAMGQGLIGIIMTSTEPAVHPYGGVSPVLRTTALAVGILHEKECAKFLEDYIHDLHLDGFSSELHKFELGRANLIVRIGPSNETGLLLSGHIDTVPVGEPTKWSTDLFGDRVKDGLLYGRGAADMKSE
ncbi:MAG: Ldh family oxidoreductase [Nitrososphaerales archaeon]